MRGNRDALASIRDEDLIEVFSHRLPDLLERRPDLEQTIFTAFLKTFARREEVGAGPHRAPGVPYGRRAAAVTETRSGSRSRSRIGSTEPTSAAVPMGSRRFAIGPSAPQDSSTQLSMVRFGTRAKSSTLPVSNRYRTSVMAERRPPTAPADRGSPETPPLSVRVAGESRPACASSSPARRRDGRPLCGG